MNIEKQSFGWTPEGKEVFKYTLLNNQGMEVDIISFGAIITAIRVPDRNREQGDVVLGFDTLDEYLGDHPYFGTMVGRFCNRVGKARTKTSNGSMSRLAAVRPSSIWLTSKAIHVEKTATPARGAAVESTM